MKVTTLRLPEELVEEIDSEYDEYGHSNRSEYVRWLLEHRERIHENTEYSNRNTLSQRVDELERRLDELEAPSPADRVRARDTAPQEPPEAEMGDDTAEHTRGRADAVTRPVRGLAEWRDLLDDPEVFSTENPEERRQQMLDAGAAAVQLVNESDDPLETADFLALFEDYPVEGQAEPGSAERASKETYWRKTLKPALDAAKEAELVRQRSGTWDWIWIGDG